MDLAIFTIFMELQNLSFSIDMVFEMSFCFINFFFNLYLMASFIDNTSSSKKLPLIILFYYNGHGHYLGCSLLRCCSSSVSVLNLSPHASHLNFFLLKMSNFITLMVLVVFLYYISIVELIKL